MTTVRRCVQSGRGGSTVTARRGVQRRQEAQRWVQGARGRTESSREDTTLPGYLSTAGKRTLTSRRPRSEIAAFLLWTYNHVSLVRHVWSPCFPRKADRAYAAAGRRVLATLAWWLGCLNPQLGGGLLAPPRENPTDRLCGGADAERTSNHCSRLAGPQQTSSCDIHFRGVACRTEPSVRQHTPTVRSSNPCARSSNLYTRSPNSYMRSLDSYMRPPNPYARSPNSFTVPDLILRARHFIVLKLARKLELREGLTLDVAVATSIGPSTARRRQLPPASGSQAVATVVGLPRRHLYFRIGACTFVQF